MKFSSLVCAFLSSTICLALTVPASAGQFLIDFAGNGPNSSGVAPGWTGIDNLVQDVASAPLTDVNGADDDVTITALDDGFNPNNTAPPNSEATHDGILVPQEARNDYLFKIADTPGTSARMRFDNLDPGSYRITLFEGRTSDTGQVAKVWVGDDAGSGEPAAENTGSFAPSGSATVTVEIGAGDALWYRHLEDGSGGISGMIINPATPSGQLLAEDFDADDGGFVESHTGPVTVGSEWTHNAGLGTWTVNGDDNLGAGNTTSNELTSPEITVPVARPIRIKFDHRYSFESGDWDGGALQISINGEPFTLVEAPAFTENGYNSNPLIGNHVLIGQITFNGDSAGYAAGEFITSSADIPALTPGDTLRIRFIGGWDEFSRGTLPNWEINSVTVQTLSDGDGDGMEDGWESANGLDPADPDDGALDPDSDDSTNLQEFTNGTDPQDSDSDDDGVLDGAETNSGTFVDANDTGTDPRNPDSDDDGLLDGVETGTGTFVGAGNTGTDPNLADSDGDGYKDGLEIANGSNPNDPSSFPGLIMLAYFNFDGQLVDQAGNTPDAILGGAAALTTGGMGFSGAGGDESIDLGSANDGSYAETPAGNHLDAAFNNNAMSVCFWQFSTAVANTSAFWVSAPTADGGARGFQAHTPWGSGTVYFDQSGCCDGPERLTVDGVVVQNTWQHFVFQRDADGNREIWVDGALVASAGGADPLDAFDGVITIGADLPHGNSFGGRIDDFAIFADALQPDQIAELASGANPSDLISPPIPFAITSVTHDPANGATTVEWNSRPNRTYAVDASDDLQFWSELDDGVSSEGESTSYSEDLPVGTAHKYYRIREVP